jgi:hypothetical protein
VGFPLRASGGRQSLKYILSNELVSELSQQTVVGVGQPFLPLFPFPPFPHRGQSHFCIPFVLRNETNRKDRAQNRASALYFDNTVISTSSFIGFTHPPSQKSWFALPSPPRLRRGLSVRIDWLEPMMFCDVTSAVTRRQQRRYLYHLEATSELPLAHAADFPS